MSREIWAFLEKKEGRLQDISFQMASEARRTADSFHVTASGIVDDLYPQQTCDHLIGYGLQRLYGAGGVFIESPEIMTRAIQVAAMASQPLFILFANSPSGSELAARLAAAMRRGLIANCIEIKNENGKPVARTSIFTDKVHSLSTWTSPPPFIATMESSVLEEEKINGRDAPEYVDLNRVDDEPLTRLIKRWDLKPKDLNLEEARIVIGVGRGVNKQIMGPINKLADSIRAIVGGSRIAVYNGLIDMQRLIGTTGKWLSSEIYISIGISGASQHLMGIKKVKNIIAINIDRQAPIFKYAQLGIVADLYDIVPKLVELFDKQVSKGQ